jgi:phage terminase large subunit-like protein
LYDIQEIAYDRNLSSLIIAPLSDSFNMVEFNQGIAYMSEPSKAWEKAVSDGSIIDNNPVMRWMVSCATVRTDANDNIKVVKPQFTKSSKRIDGVITSIMANNRCDVGVAEMAYSSSLTVDDMVY